MAEELQGILDRINADGIAKAEAAGIVKNANSEADAFRKRAENALVQAARDIKISLKGELESRINKAVENATSAALTGEFMAELIREAAAKFISSPDEELSVSCAIKDVEKLEAALKGALADSLTKEPEILGVSSVRGGLELSLKNGAFCIDFTSEAVNDLFSAYAGKLVENIVRES